MRFLDKRRIFEHLFQKIFIFVIILGICLIMSFFIFSGPVFAQPSFTEGFEDFDLGTIYGQDGWDCDPSNQAGWIVTSTAHSGEKSLSLDGASPYYRKARKTGLDPRDTGRLTFWIYPVSGYLKLILPSPAGIDSSDYNNAWLELKAGELRLRTTQYELTMLATGIDFNEWSLIQIEWDFDTQLIRGKVDDSNWSNWTSDWLGDFPIVNTFGFKAETIDYIGENYIDDIKYGEEWATMPVIEPTYPEVGTTTEIEVGKFNATGHYWWDPVDPTDWFDLVITFRDVTDEYNEYFSILDISASSSADYLIPVTIPDTGTFDVSYKFWGNSWLDCVFLPCYPQMVTFSPDLATTTIIIGETGLPPWVEVPTLDFYEEEEPEAGTIQHFLWSIKNFFKSLILPTQEAQSSFLDKVRTIREKFPYNYISEIKDFMASTKEDVEQDPTIEFALLGAEGTVHTSFFDTEIVIGEETKALYLWIKIMASLILFGGFMVYTISFIRRIL